MISLSKSQDKIARSNSTARRILSKVIAAGDCWLWSATAAKGSYGFIHHEGRTRKVHRVSYEVFCGEIPDGLFVCHHCDQPACVNPRHLFVGRATDNMRDMLRKGRARSVIDRNQTHFKSGHAPRGEEASGAKLTEAQVVEIISRRRSGELTRALASEYGVHRTTIQRLVRGKHWSDAAGRAALKDQGEGR